MDCIDLARRVYTAQSALWGAGGVRPEDWRLVMHYDDWYDLMFDPDPRVRGWVKETWGEPERPRTFRGTQVLIDSNLSVGEPRLRAEVSV